MLIDWSRDPEAFSDEYERMIEDLRNVREQEQEQEQEDAYTLEVVDWWMR